MSSKIIEKQMIAEIPEIIARFLDVTEADVKVQRGTHPTFDLFVKAGKHRFALELKSASSPGVLTKIANQFAEMGLRLPSKIVPVLVVPFMNAASRQAAKRGGISWFDLSGNARIVAPNLRIIIDGQPDRFRTPGRPASIFAPKSARVVRWLLVNDVVNQGKNLTQREIARDCDMSEGFVSRIVSRLEKENYIVRDAKGAIHSKDSRLFLEAWRAEYRFDKHLLIAGHVPARSGDALSHFVADTLTAESVEHAATGLAAAWEMTRFAMFRIATFYLADYPSSKLREKLGFREDKQGANLWLVVPNDIGVFQGATGWGHLRCVHPVQAYLDLFSHPERAYEAAADVYNDCLKWKSHG